VQAAGSFQRLNHDFREDELWKLGLHGDHGSVQCLAPDVMLLRIEEHTVLGHQLVDCGAAARRVMLAEYVMEIAPQEGFDGLSHGFTRFLFLLGFRARRELKRHLCVCFNQWRSARQRTESPMRTLFGMILGVFLTIGFAYVYDASTGNSEPSAQTSLEQRPMVNWDVVSGNWHKWTVGINNTWKKLAAAKL
jgi:hypothetical protein